MSALSASAQAFYQLLASLRQEAPTERDKGTSFEILSKAFLKNDSRYKNAYKAVYLWAEWPDREQYFGEKSATDIGIDLVAESKSGGFCAVQCKFYRENYHLRKEDIDSFFTASGKECFSERLIISTSANWSPHAESALEGQKPQVARIGLKEFEESDIDWQSFSFKNPEQPLRFQKQKKLRPHQSKAVTAVLEGFKNHERGKLIMACGTGKTFTALKLAEELIKTGQQKNAGAIILFLAPSIALVSQTLSEWSKDISSQFELFPLVVCSDIKVGKGLQKRDEANEEDIHAYDLPFPATTNSEKLAGQIQYNLTQSPPPGRVG